MKQYLLTLLAVFTFFNAYTQCSDLFFSGYVEGYGNNRALEIYNPTANAISLSGYMVGRFSNGATTFTGVQLPNATIAAYGTYVVALDKRDSTATGLETPIWNGYQLWDTCRDAVSGQPILDDNGAVVFCVQYDANGMHLYGTTYHDFLDLEGRADVFLCPDYNSNNAMYFNGDDAVALVKGTSVFPDGSNILDVVGVIGEDPGDTWETPTGQWITKDKSLVRNPNVNQGTGAVVFVLGDTLAYDEWTILPKNTFTELDDYHICVCAVSTQPINTVDFEIYPNPADGAFSIEAAEQIERIEVFNLMGQLMESVHGIQNTKTTILLNTDLKGLHIVKIHFENNSIAIYKLMLQ
jgi:hypothetical protein